MNTNENAPRISTLAKYDALAKALGCTPASIIDPDAIYETYGIEGIRHPSARMYGVCSGEAALEMIARSSSPWSLAFRVTGECRVCGEGRNYCTC